MQGFFQGISFRLAKVGVFIALFVGTLMSAVQIYIDYQVQESQMARSIARVIDASTAPALRAVDNHDALLAREVALGLIKYEHIVAVTLEDFDQMELAGASKPRLHSKTSWLTRLVGDEVKIYRAPLRADSSEHLGKSGQLSIVVDVDKTLKPFYQNSAIIISIGLLRSSFLVLFLFFAFYYLLTKPLFRVVTEIKSINPENPGEQRLTLPVGERDDELKQLVYTNNQLLDSVDLALAKRRAVEVVLRKSEEHVRQIIDSLPVWVGARNKHGHYIFANKALASFLQTTPDAMRGSHISDFSGFFVTALEKVIELDKEVIESRINAQIWEEKWMDIDGKKHEMHTHVMPMEFYDEVVALVVSSDITELKRVQAQMEHMAYHDALTGLPNRSYLVDRLGKELSRASKYCFYGALLFIDLDQFKYINDSLGHPVGDGMLKHVAKRLTSIVTESDMVVRLGGDEFVVVLANLGQDLSQAIIKAEDIGERARRYVCEPHFYKDIQLRVTCSVGIVIFPEEDAGVHELLSYADTAMYQVKEQGRDAIQFFNKFMADKARNVLVMEADLHSGIENSRFSLLFQPRLDAETSRIVGAEALLRWQHPDRGVISPSEFIPILETSGLIVEVGMWVIKQSIIQVQRWRNRGLWQDSMRISVNISPRQFRFSRFVDDVIHLLEKQNFPASLLEMEITEGIVIHNLDETINTMSILKDQGVCFALDDFGTGYSSISYLKQLPVSILKIDQSFVRDITFDRSDRILVETIVAMGRMLELDVVAEGVETEAQLELLKKYRCPYHQGFLSSRPLGADGFEELLLESAKIS